MPWVWAAYRKGGLNKAHFPTGLSQDEFSDRVVYFLDAGNCHEMYMLETDRPVGVAVGTIEDNKLSYESPHMFPHIYWFPWSSPRDRVSALGAFLEHVNEKYLVLAAVLLDDKRIFEFIADAGFGRRIGSVLGYYKPGQKVALFQGTRNG